MNYAGDIRTELRKQITRRWFFRECGVGLGAMALASLLGERAAAAASSSVNPLAPKAGHFPASAKRVIFLFHSRRAESSRTV